MRVFNILEKSDSKIHPKYILSFLKFYWIFFAIFELLLYLLTVFGLTDFKERMLPWFGIFIFFSFVTFPILYPTLIWILFREISGKLKAIYSPGIFILLFILFITLIIFITLAVLLYFFVYMIKYLGDGDYPTGALLIFAIPITIAERVIHYYYKRFGMI